MIKCLRHRWMLLYTTLVLTLMLTAFTAKAHKVGSAQWCLMYTAAHWECLYAESDKCEDMLKNVKKFITKNPPKSILSEATPQQKIDLTCIPNPTAVRSDQF